MQRVTRPSNLIRCSKRSDVFLMIDRDPDRVALVAAQADHVIADVPQIKGDVFPAIVPAEGDDSNSPSSAMVYDLAEV